jgi:hypothetical protein
MDNPPRRREIRFSLWGLFVLVAVLGVFGAALVNAWKLRQSQERMVAANSEIRKLQDELGYLTIDDPERVHVRQIKTLDRLTWKWRIYLPAGYFPNCSFALNGITDVGLPNRSFWLEAPAGIGSSPMSGLAAPREPLASPKEFTYTVSIERSVSGLSGSDWMLMTGWRRLAKGGGEIGYSIGSPIKDATEWIEQNHGSTITVTGGPSTASFGVDEPVPLLRLRVHQKVEGVGVYLSTSDPADGLMLWMDNR